MHRGVQAVQLVYSDGLRSFSLFENPTAQLPAFDRGSSRHIQVGSSGGEAAYVGGQGLISWNASGLNLTMVGDLTPKELAGIGASIRL
jgi:negative regulator of sigma E activity